MKERDALDLHYKYLIHNIMKYEEVNVDFYSDSDLAKRITTNPTVGDFKEKIDNVQKAWKNPYRDAYLWLKGELLDIKGLSDALQGREAVVKM